MKTVAVIGAGFCGLAVTWELLQKNYQVDLFDPAGIGGGASGVSAGLLHPFAGVHAKLLEGGRVGVQEALKLLEIASQAIGRSVFEKTGMLRLAVTKEMAADFKCSSELHKDVIWMTAQECQAKVSGLAPFDGIWEEDAWTVRSELYLQGLWMACEKRGASLMSQRIESLNSVAHYDALVVTAGAAAKNIAELLHLPVTPIKGQVLELAWPKNLAPLSFPINGQAYIIMQPENQSCLVGATFERKFSTGTPNSEIAQREILPKVIALLPDLRDAQVLDCRAGIRASTPGHKPLLKQIDSKSWLLIGMGSKGLLYHAHYAKRLIANFSE